MSEAFSSVEPITRNRMIPKILRRRLRVNHRHTHTETIPSGIQVSNKPLIRVETEKIIGSLRFWGRVLNRWSCLRNRHRSPSLRILCQDTDRCNVHAAFITLQLLPEAHASLFIFIYQRNGIQSVCSEDRYIVLHGLLLPRKSVQPSHVFSALFFWNQQKNELWFQVQWKSDERIKLLKK